MIKIKEKDCASTKLLTIAGNTTSELSKKTAKMNTYLCCETPVAKTFWQLMDACTSSVWGKK